MEKFEKLLGKESHILNSIKIRGFHIPSEIQEKSIPAILEKKDVIAGASTGSGKTLAFAAGLINNIAPREGLQGLILTPTRELAEQITKEILHFSKSKNLKVISVYGGVSISNQIDKLETADIVVGTPGRILDHIGRKTINLTKVNTLVLDEADRMLDMGFRDDVEEIVSKVPKKRHTLLFSATISEEVVYLAKKYMINPVEISAEPLVDPTKLTQVYYDVEDGLKYSLLRYLLENEKAKLVMIFCNTRRNVDFLSKNLQLTGAEAVAIHGGLSQDKRTRMLNQFHSDKVHVLVATDVAARGLDIKGVSHIYNYDIPPTKKEYIHRIGRTARAGEEGKVINILASRDYENFNNLLGDDLTITKEETPLIKRIEIKWKQERSYGGRDRGRERRGYSRSSNSRGRSSYGGSSGGYKGRSSYGGSSGGYRGRSDDRDKSSDNRDRPRKSGYREGRNYGRGDRKGSRNRPRRSFRRN